MTSFTIDADDHIAIATGALKPQGADHFTSRDELAHLTTQWPASRLVRLWNGLPSVTPVRRFTDRRTALDRIWKALANGSARSTSRSKASRKSRPRSKTTGIRVGTKKAQVIRMLQRSNGASIAEIIAYASHCTSLGRCEGFSLTKGFFDNLTPLLFCGGLGPGFS